MSDPTATAPTGYSRTTKVLHWATVALLLTQFAVGYLLDMDDDLAEAAREARADRLEERADRNESREESLEARADRLEDVDGDDPPALLDRVFNWDEPLLTLHVVLGLSVLLLAVVRLIRRRVVALPPWAETLSAGERRWEHWTEQVLYATLVLMPLSGIGVLLVDDDLLPLHVGAHVTFFVALAAHVGLVLKHQLVDRDRLLHRML